MFKGLIKEVLETLIHAANQQREAHNDKQKHQNNLENLFKVSSKTNILLDIQVSCSLIAVKFTLLESLLLTY